MSSRRPLFNYVLLFCCLFQACCQGLSNKAKKLQRENEDDPGFDFNDLDLAVVESTSTTTKDPFEAFFDEDEDSKMSTTTTTEDPFFSFDDNAGFDMDDSFLPSCENLFEEDRAPGINCDNSTLISNEVPRFHDPVFERLIAQVWSDLQYKLNHESQLYGVVLDPFDVDAKLPQPIDIEQNGSGYSAKVQMHGIKVKSAVCLHGSRKQAGRRGCVTCVTHAYDN